MTSVAPKIAQPGLTRPRKVRRRTSGPVMPALGAGAALLILSACMPTGSDARRSAYLDCARDQGLTVVEGTIRTGSAAELRRLDACEALPR